MLQVAAIALDSTIGELNTAFGQVDKIRDEIRNDLTAWIAVERDCVPNSDSTYCKVVAAVRAAGNDLQQLRATADLIDDLFSDKKVNERVAAFKQIVKNHEAELREQAKRYTAHLITEIQSLIDRLLSVQLSRN